ncbi:MFS transporter [Schaalia sp. Marseille-Q2122]|uniref:MFS transporter n=1 Tax=Schaalia sp. Marseille-Q2122 TaxID=2736604 RepID=UPI00158DE8C0|nr:MFS transporter [Schaalia sp. Marseille-Q2122]
MSQPEAAHNAAQASATTPSAQTPQTDAPQKAKLFTRPILEWAAWDWGSAAFNAVATTFIFSVYLTTDGLFTNETDAHQYLSWGLTIAGLVIALLAPVTGQRADRAGRGGLLVGIFTYAVVACMGVMYFVYPDSPLGPIGALWLGIALLGLGNIFFEFASVNYNAMLNHLADKKNMGRVSGLGWGAGYVGGIVLLLVLFFGFIKPEVGLFGVTGENNLDIRVSMLIAAAWFGIFALPVVIRPPKPKRTRAPEAPESMLESYRRLFQTVKNLATEAPHTLKFLIASAVFRDGLAGVFTFGAILAASAFGFAQSEVLMFGVAANIVAGIATISFGALDDRFGPKRVIEASLFLMILAGMGVFFMADYGKIAFWVLGLILCVFVGPVQSASRSFLARIIPEGREGEVFGLYATTGRAVSFLAPAMYGISVWIGSRIVGEGAAATHWGIVGIVLILAVGLLLLIPIREDDAHINIYEG